MKVKFPMWKVDIPVTTNPQFEAPRATLEFEKLIKLIESLKPRVAPGTGGLRNKHLTALLFSDNSPASLTATNAIHQLHHFSNYIIQGNLPWYFFVTWSTTSLIAINKLETGDLSPGQTMGF